jgi:hypothetical protein
MLLEGGPDIGPRRIVHGPGDVDTADLGGEGWSEPGDRYRHGWCSPLPSFIPSSA